MFFALAYHQERYRFTDLWYAEAGNGEPGDEVALELAEGVVPAPVEHGEDMLQAEPYLLGSGQVLVLPQWVDGEERQKTRRRGSSSVGLRPCSRAHAGRCPRDGAMMSGWRGWRRRRC